MASIEFYFKRIITISLYKMKRFPIPPPPRREKKKFEGKAHKLRTRETALIEFFLEINLDNSDGLTHDDLAPTVIMPIKMQMLAAASARTPELALQHENNKKWPLRWFIAVCF